jgi:argininosuccinate lyase
MLTLLKGLPSTYNKDLQLDKGILFQTHDDLKLVFDLTLAVIDTLIVVC